MRLDLGCGKNKKEGFHGVDSIPFEGVDTVMDLTGPWPWEDDSVEEVHCSHFIEHLAWPDRVKFFNELYRVMKKDAKAAIILPHWASSRYYGDPTHKEPFSEFAFYYLSKKWRDDNAPHVGYTCDFQATWGYSLNPALVSRNQEFQQHAMSWFKEAVTDIHATLIKL